MRAHRFEFSSLFRQPAARLWRFHMRPDAFRLLTPKVMRMRVLDPGSGVAEDSLVRFEVGVWPLRQRWSALHGAVREGQSFTDVAIEGPFPYWVHQHTVTEVTRATSSLTDVVWFAPPAWLRHRPGVALVRLALTGLFAWRHRQTRRHLERRAGRSVTCTRAAVCSA